MSTAHTLSPAQAGQIAARGRQMLRRRIITPHQYALLDTVLWASRKPGSGLLTASLAVLARLAGIARSTVIQAIRRLEELGLIQRIRRRARVVWGGSVASRVIANAYTLKVPDTETDPRSAREEPLRISLMEAPTAAVRGAQEALASRRRVLEARMLGKGTAV